MKLGPLFTEIINETVERDKIITAIENKRLITIYYDSPHDGDNSDYKKGWRRIEPFCYGVNKSGNPVLRAWQEHGVSYSYPPGKKNDPLTHNPGWRMFRIDGIKSINTIGNDRFLEPRPKYNPKDKDMTTIYKAADFSNPTQPPITNTPQQPVNTPPSDVTTTKSAEPQKQTILGKLADRFKNLINYK